MPNRPIAHALPRLLTLAVLLFCSLTGSPACAQDDAEAPPPPRKKDGVQITFLPPPMQGVISLGIYETTGKLARVLHRAATEKDFVIGLNGLITKWDGKDDKGDPMPPGKYAGRGWMTGDLGIEGVAFHGNDWMKEDGPRFVEMLRFEKQGGTRWHVVLRSADQAEHSLPIGEEEPATPAEWAEWRFAAELTQGEKVVKSTVGFGGNWWAIVETPSGREVRCYAQNGEFLRRLAYRPEEPPPFDLAASARSETILLLEKNAREQRFRILGEPQSKGEESTWKTIEQKRIVVSDTFASIAAELGRAEPPKPEATVKIVSKLNPLLQNARAEAHLRASVSAEGVWLETTDGLPLIQVTDVKGLKWGALVPEGKALILFQSDGAVVEEFKIERPENLMSFDAGDYTLKK